MPLSLSGDFHLGPSSPCIDAGRNDAPFLSGFDFEGDARIIDGYGDKTATVDTGVDEAPCQAPPPPVEVEVDVKPGNLQNVINLGPRARYR